MNHWLLGVRLENLQTWGLMLAVVATGLLMVVWMLTGGKIG
jgi:hypothetical protein